jgi:hypothetical protein
VIVLRRLACVLAAGLVLATGPAPAVLAQTSEPNNAASLSMRDDEMRMVNALLDAFTEVMTPDEQAILREIDVRIPMDYDVTRVVAYRDDSGRAIEVGFGFFGLAIQLCDDEVLADYYAAQDPGIYDKFEAYVTSLNEAIDRNEQSTIQNALPRFAPFAGIPEETATARAAQEDFKSYAANLHTSAIAFVLAHEIGHHVLGHTDMPPPESPAVSRERESAADRYAAELTMRVGMPAFGALPALALFAAAEGETLDPQASHPLGTCRILGAMLDSIDRLAADERTIHLLDQSPDMMPGGERYEYFRTQMQTNCS